MSVRANVSIKHQLASGVSPKSKESQWTVSTPFCPTLRAVRTIVMIPGGMRTRHDTLYHHAFCIASFHSGGSMGGPTNSPTGSFFFFCRS